MGLALDESGRIPSYCFSFGEFKQAVSLKSKNPHVKVLVALLGYFPTWKYSKLVASASTRAVMVSSIVGFIEKYGFDGLNLDSKYPGSRGCNYSDKENFVLLLKDLRTAFDSKGLLLTASVNVNKDIVQKAYDIPSLSEYLDFIFLMTYSLHEQFKTSHHAPLYTSDSSKPSMYNVVQYWITQGADSRKLVVGIPFFGRSYTLRDPDNHGLGEEVDGYGTPAQYSEKYGQMAYAEVTDQM